MSKTGLEVIISTAKLRNFLNVDTTYVMKIDSSDYFSDYINPLKAFFHL